MATKLLWGDKDISNWISTITWSGSVTEAARQLEFTIAYAPQDYYIPVLDIQCGDKIKFYEDDKEWFRGTVIIRNKTSSNGTLTYTAYDDIFYLLHNKRSYNFSGITPEEITRRVLQDFGYEIGQLAHTGLPVSLLSNDMLPYDIVQAAYTLAHDQNGLLYGMVAREGKMIVYQRGWTVANFEISEDTNLSESSYSESIENMVNAVNITDSTGAIVGYVSNADWVSRYGEMSGIYQQEDNVDAKTAANGILNGPEQTASLTAIGNSYCLFGNSVKIKDVNTGLVGVFYIESDSHTWENGTHMMSLDLMFKAYMDEKEGQSDESSNNSTGTTNGVVWPCPEYTRISSGYGYRIHPISGIKKFHDGVDLAAAFGAPILAFKSGTVVKAGDNGGYGNYISIQHSDGLLSFYGHCSALFVKAGATVNAGQKIAAVGSTGSSTGNHLHFGMKLNDNSVNPMNYVSPSDTVDKLSSSIGTSTTSGTTVSALFTAYYPANNAMEGGLYDAQGNKLDPSKLTCAAPKGIPFGTKIKVINTGTNKDGVIYTVTDRGGAITVVNNVYHFDLLMSSSAECNKWGRVNGKALIIQ